MNKIFNVDINVTRSCNFNCTYCFAKPQTEQKDSNAIIFSSIKAFLNELCQSIFFNSKFDILNIGFWGGEPTLRPHLINSIITECNAENIKFFIYSNGYHLSKSIRTHLKKLKNEVVIEDKGDGFGKFHPKLCIQISYDGNPIHDKHRKFHFDTFNTSKSIKDNIKWLDKNEIPYVLKSTIPPTSFKYMYDAYMDIKKLGCELKGNGFKNIDYFPTIDYYSTYSKKEMKILCQDLKKSLIKIAREELKTQNPIFKWFKQNRALCTAGKDMIAIDVDGFIYNCHGCLYGENKSNHLIGMTSDINIFYKLKTNYEYLNKGINDERECSNCPVTFCLRCNHAKYINSNKTEYLDKWRDFKSQPELCEFYKVNYKVKLAYDILRRK